MTNRIKFAAADGSKTNFGIAIMELDLDTLEISVLDLILTKTEKSKNKQVRALRSEIEKLGGCTHTRGNGLKGSTAKRNE